MVWTRRRPCGTPSSVAETHDAFQPFPTTRWSRILAVRDEDEAERDRAWETLAASYWKPVYAYIRASTGKKADEARDLTQDLFVWMIESNLLGRADPSRGRFRALLKVAIQHFLVDVGRAQRRLKRGGGRAIVSLNLREEDLPAMEFPDPQGRTPDEILNDTWRNELLGRGVAILEARYREEGRPVYFEVFRDFFLAEDLDYATAAGKYGIKVSDVSNYLMHAKRRYRTVLEELVADTVTSPEELREEIAWLLRS